MERSCELCSKAARMYCESDEARLCWDCDEKVHSANFLVAKHSRSLLCHVCQSPTPWKASGTKLGPTVSVCEGCFDAQNPTSSRMRTGMRRPHQRQEDEDETDRIVGMEVGDRGSESSSGRSTDEHYSSDEEEDDEIHEDEEEEEEGDDDGENQVVPWASCPSQSAPSAPPLATSSSSEHGSFSTRNDVLKRSRDCRIQDSDDEDVSCSSQANSSMTAEGIRGVAAFGAAKIARVEDHLELRRRRMELVGSLMSFQERTAAAGGEHNCNASEVIRRISNLSRDSF